MTFYTTYKPLPPEMLAENPDDVRAGASNLAHHIEILQRFGVPAGRGVAVEQARPDRSGADRRLDHHAAAGQVHGHGPAIDVPAPRSRGDAAVPRDGQRHGRGLRRPRLFPQCR